MIIKQPRNPALNQFLSFNLPIKGIASVVISELDEQGELVTKKTICQKNLINRRTVEKLLMTNASVFDDTLRIAISTDIIVENYEQITISNIIAIGDPNLSGVTGYTFTPESMSFPANGTYHNRFLQPSIARSFNSIAIVEGTTNNDLPNVTNDCFTILTFPSAVNQGTTEIIDIFYKVYIDWQNNPNNLKPEFQTQLENFLLSQFTSPLQYEDHNPITFFSSPNNPDPYLITGAVEGESFTETYIPNVAFLKRKYTLSMNFEQDSIYSGLAYGRLEPSGTNLNALRGTAGIISLVADSTLSNVFSHNETSTALWYDSNSLAGSTYKPVLTDSGSQTDHLPSLIALKVVTSGGVGIGTFKIYKTLYSGGANDNQWAQHPKPLHVTQKYPIYFSEDDDIPFAARWIYEWSTVNKWVSGRGVKIAIWSIAPELSIEASWDLGVSNSVVTINDIATDFLNELIYVASQEGLYKIDPNEIPANQVTQLSADKAKAVDVGFNGTVFAVLIDGGNVGRLASSLNAGWGDAHSFSGTINFENVLFIRCDRNNSDHQLAILEYNWNPLGVAQILAYINNTVGKVHWWDFPNGYTGTPIDCQMKTNLTSYFHKAFNYPYNSSFTVKSTEGGNAAIWVFPRWFGVRQNFYGTIKGYTGDMKLAFDTVGTDVFEPDGNIDLTNRIGSCIATIGAARFNQSLRAETYSSDDLLESCIPSYQILDLDISNDLLSIITGGWIESDSTGTGYSAARIDRTVGCLDLTVSTVSNTDGTINSYKGSAINTYYFTHYSSGSGTAQGYYLRGNCQLAKNLGILNFMEEGLSQIDYGFAGGYDFTDTHFQPLMIGFWGAYDRINMFDPTYKGWKEIYAWNPTLNGGAGDWELDPLDIGQGKPLYVSGTEALIDGIDLSWIDLAPSLSIPTEDLIANQFYTFVWIPGGKAIASDGTYPAVNLAFYYYLRPIIITPISGTIPASPYQITLPEASSDALWFGLDPDGDELTINIDGYLEPATIITSGSPNINEILIVDHRAGTLEFNATDETKTYTGTGLYGQKIHSTEL